MHFGGRMFFCSGNELRFDDKKAGTFKDVLTVHIVYCIVHLWSEHRKLRAHMKNWRLYKYEKNAVLTLVLTLALILSACGKTVANQEMQLTQLGTSALSIVLPQGYALAEDEYDEDQVAYYYKDDNSVDFDVYQWEKGDQYTLESEAIVYAADYGTVPEPVVVNEMNGMKYTSEEEYEGAVYTVVNYMFEDDTNIVELCFWTAGSEEEYAAIDAIISTLKQN